MVDVRISVVMVDGAFRGKFHLIDYLENQTLPRDRYELIWVEYYSSVREELASKKGVHIITLNMPDESRYHSSYCFNEGIRQSSGEILVIPDADVVVGPHFLETIAVEHEKHDEMVMYVPRWDEPEERHRDEVSLEYLQKVCVFRNPFNYGSCLTVHKDWLLVINGYEQHEAFAGGLHANGLDLYTRFKNLGLAIKWHPTERIYHPWHPRTMVSGESYQWQSKIIERRALALTKRAYFGLDGQFCLASEPSDIPKRNSKAAYQKREGVTRLIIEACTNRGFFKGMCFVGARVLDCLAR
jgi:hypothetical protein